MIQHGLLVRETHRGAAVLRLPANALLWEPGDGQVRTDPRRSRRATGSSYRVVEPTPNTFFRSLYQTTARNLVATEGREHTAAVPYDRRQDRERRFRRGELPVLFCSPTMELGIDIADLNMVHLRSYDPV